MTRPPKAEDLPTLERKLKGVRQEVRNLQVMQMRPNQPAEKLKLLSELERSARAEAQPRQRALQNRKKPAAEVPAMGSGAGA